MWLGMCRSDIKRCYDFQYFAPYDTRIASHFMLSQSSNPLIFLRKMATFRCFADQ